MKHARRTRGRSHLGGLIFLCIAGFAVLWAARQPGEVAVFGGRERRVTGEFDGAEMTAVFGGVKLDLREATMRGKEAVVHLTTAFGGAELFVPEDWEVTPENQTIFGGFEDHTRHGGGKTAPRLIIEGQTIFGGVEVKN